MIERPIWWDYIVLDEEGEIERVSDEAPAEARRAYEEYKRIQEQGYKL